MQQHSGGVVDLTLRYRQPQSGLAALRARQVWDAVEARVLFLALCILWGIVLFSALTALR